MIWGGGDCYCRQRQRAEKQECEERRRRSSRSRGNEKGFDLLSQKEVLKQSLMGRLCLLVVRQKQQPCIWFLGKSWFLDLEFEPDGLLMHVTLRSYSMSCVRDQSSTQASPAQSLFYETKKDRQFSQMSKEHDFQEGNIRKEKKNVIGMIESKALSYWEIKRQ